MNELYFLILITGQQCLLLDQKMDSIEPSQISNLYGSVNFSQVAKFRQTYFQLTYFFVISNTLKRKFSTDESPPELKKLFGVVFFIPYAFRRPTLVKSCYDQCSS